MPVEVYEVIKTKIEEKFQNMSFSVYVQKYLEALDNQVWFFNNISENFLEFLFKEKVNLSFMNFFELEFNEPGKFEEKPHWNEQSAPPFSPRKVELLLNMCNKKINKEHLYSLDQKLMKTIKTNQFEKVKVILKYGSLPNSMIQEFLNKHNDIQPKYIKLFKREK